MALVLAVEPDQRQAAILTRVIHERIRAELIVVDSRDAAMAALTARVPDVILLTALLSPRDEDEMVAHLRTLAEADHVQTHTIPQLASAGSPSVAPAGAGGLLSKFRRKNKKEAEPITGCDPKMFADEVRTFLARAAELKAQAGPALIARAPQPGAPRRDGHPAEPPADAEVEASSAWSSPFEWRRAEPANEAVEARAETPQTAHPHLVVATPIAVAAEEDEQRREEEGRAHARAEAEAEATEKERRRAETAAAAERERARRQAEAAAKAQQREQEAREVAERVRLEAIAAAEKERVRLEAIAAAEQERVRLEAIAAAEQERVRLEAIAAAEKERVRLEAIAAAEKERVRLEAIAAAERERARRAEEERARLAAEAAALEEQLRREAAAAAERERLRIEAEAAAARERVRLEAEAAAAREQERLEAEAEVQREQLRMEAAAAERERARAEHLRQAVEAAVAARAADPFADFRIGPEDTPSLLRLMPLAFWARQEPSPAQRRLPASGLAVAAPPAGTPADELRELMAGLSLPPQIAGVSYARGCRIRRVRVPASSAPRVQGAPPLIVSRRALDQMRAEG